ncbi:hypothetical protein QAD02_002531 [Eretmocerus hayati]|uniref:Uncharacterized protein n=1 Tax=Eretmocerus hayati TaxID=131215 RepID=A0ACC2NJJ1_9HYME|nr:hypothetical protein QAD02_002531 [Eretmocerus hayati]
MVVSNIRCGPMWTTGLLTVSGTPVPRVLSSRRHGLSLNAECGSRGRVANAHSERLHQLATTAHTTSVDPSRRRPSAASVERLSQMSTSARAQTNNSRRPPPREPVTLPRARVMAVYRDGYGERHTRSNARARTDRSRRTKRFLVTNSLQHYHMRSGAGYEERKAIRYKHVPDTNKEQIYLAENIAVDQLSWNLIIKENDKTYIETKAEVLWSAEEIVDTALDITQVRNAIPGRPIRPIDRERLLLLISESIPQLLARKGEKLERR